ncbi:MAG: hypothetical protein PSY14_05890 [bacterium]|nr:hypothetical protein [bacterium]
MDNFWAGAFGTVIWLAFLRLYFAARKKEWKFNIRSYKSWILAAVTVLVFVIFFISSCQCTTQESISNSSIMRDNLRKINPSDLQYIDEAHRVKNK